MPADYILVKSPNSVQRVSDGAFIPFDPANTDYQTYLTWVAAGNVPDPYVAPPPPIPSVSMWQARAMMAQTTYNPSSAQSAYQAAVAGTTNVLAATNALVTAVNNPVLNAYWEYATTLSSGDTMLVNLATYLGLTTAQVTTLFTEAAALSI